MKDYWLRMEMAAFRLAARSAWTVPPLAIEREEAALDNKASRQTTPSSPSAWGLFVGDGGWAGGRI